MMASIMRRLLWCRTTQIQIRGPRGSCSASSARMTRGTVPMAKSQTLGPSMTKVLKTLLEDLGGDRHARAARRHLDVAAAPPVAAQAEVNAPLVAVGLRQQHRSGAVAEEDAGRADRSSS